MTMDLNWVFAATALGWGLSLFIYRWFAVAQDLPMGELQAQSPVVPRLLGGAAMGAGVLFIIFLMSWDLPKGVALLLVGIGFGVFWTMVLRTYSQVSLFLAPLAAVALLFTWFI